MSDHAPARRIAGPARSARSARSRSSRRSRPSPPAVAGRRPPTAPHSAARVPARSLPATPTLAPSGRPVSGYVARQGQPAARRSRLAARQTRRDRPGHGGYFHGCMGVNGLSEAEVNLGVALRLRDLLVARGAMVLLTRDRDRDFLTPPTSSLKGDLAERARMANAFAPRRVRVGAPQRRPGRPSRRERDADLLPARRRRAVVRPRHRPAPLHGAQPRHRGAEAAAGNSRSCATATRRRCSPRRATPRIPKSRRACGRPAQQLEAEAILTGLATWFARLRPIVESLALAEGDTARVTRTGLPLFEGRIAGACDVVGARVDDARRA